MESTSVITVLSSVHGRQRRIERNIGKRDLQAAVKYGTKSKGHPCPRTGARCWLFTFADVVYVTDDDERQEITSWPLQGGGIDVEKVTIDSTMQKAHDAAVVSAANLAKWTSHTVVVVDQSGSMHKADVDHATRADVVWVALACDFVGNRLRDQEVDAATDVFTLIGMQNDSTILLNRRPCDWVLYNDLMELLRTLRPLGAGNYLPALDLAESVLLHNSSGSCALQLLFLSDGRPSNETGVGEGSSLSGQERQKSY
jgi:hypothetical protein